MKCHRAYYIIVIFNTFWVATTGNERTVVTVDGLYSLSKRSLHLILADSAPQTAVTPCIYMCVTIIFLYVERHPRCS